MHRRDLASLAALATLALTVGVGCPEDPKATPTPPPKTSAAAKPPVSAAPSATPSAAANTGPAGAMGTATIKGVVNFTGKSAPEMKVPKARKTVEVCKAKE